MLTVCGVHVHVLPSGPIQTNAYLLTEPSTGQAVLVDAPEGIWDKAAPLLARDGCRLAALWLTHGHWDHTQGGAEVVRRSGAKVFAHKGDRILIETPEVMRSRVIPGLVLEAIAVDTWLENGAVLDALGEKVRVSHVPGHSPGSIMFHFPTAGSVFSGDVLFRQGVGRTDLPGGSFDELEASIRTHLYSLPEATVVYPGHGGPTRVGDERQSNPYVGA